MFLKSSLCIFAVVIGRTVGHEHVPSSLFAQIVSVSFSLCPGKKSYSKSNIILKNSLKYYKRFLTTFGKLFIRGDKFTHNCITITLWTMLTWN